MGNLCIARDPRVIMKRDKKNGKYAHKHRVFHRTVDSLRYVIPLYSPWICGQRSSWFLQLAVRDVEHEEVPMSSERAP